MSFTDEAIPEGRRACQPPALEISACSFLTTTLMAGSILLTANGHLEEEISQNPTEPTLRATRPALLELRAPPRQHFCVSVSPEKCGRDSLQAHRGPRFRVRRH